MLYFTHYTKLNIPGPILESKGMRASFQKKGKKKGKKWQNIWKFWQKMYKIWSYFEKGQPRACDYRTHETARICPVYKL